MILSVNGVYDDWDDMLWEFATGSVVMMVERPLEASVRRPGTATPAESQGLPELAKGPVTVSLTTT